MDKQQLILIGCLMGLFSCLFLGIYYLFQLFNFHKMLKKAWEESFRVLDERRVSRKSEEKRYTALYGEMEKKNFIARLDGMLAYSGLYTRFPNLTAEILAAGLLLEGALLLLVGWIFTGNLLLGLGVSAFVLYAELQVLQLLRAIRRRKINAELLHCIDLMEIHAYTTDSVIEILRKTSVQVKEPLKSELERTVDDAEFSGQVSASLRRLCNRMEHKYLKDLILNLDICSHAKANYKEVLIAAKKIFIQDMANTEKLHKLYQNSFLFTILLAVAGVIGLDSMLSIFSTTGAGNSAFEVLWYSGDVGRLITIYIVFVTIAGLWHIGKKAFL